VAADIPTSEPAELRTGDTWKWTKTLADYPASAWTLKYRFKNAAGGFEITATASGDDYSVTVAATTSAGYAAGTYSWMAWVEGGTSEKYTVDSGVCTINPDYRSGTATAAFDDRSHARKTLAAIESWIESSNPGVAEYEIAGRRMKYWSAADLIKLRLRYQQEVAAEIAAENLANGIGAGRRIQFRI
jgi:hypothetical protein